MNFIKKWGLSGFLILAFFIAATFIFFKSDFRTPLRGLFSPKERKILSVATGRIFPDKGIGKVLKIMTPDEGLILEVYGDTQAGIAPLIDKIIIGQHRDAYFQFQARATNLALKDMDGDNEFEIIAPSFDNSLVSHLNIYRYNSDSKRFEPYVE